MTQPTQEPIETTRDLASMTDLLIPEPPKAENIMLYTIDRDYEKFDKIKDMCCWYYSLDWEKVVEPNRQKEVVMCRKMIMYLAKKHTALTLKWIGLRFKSSIPNRGLDHATVINAIQKMEDHISIERKTVADFKEINRRLLLLDLFKKQ